MSGTRGGAKLRDWLAREQRSQRWLAEQVGVHQGSVSAWIIGKFPPPLAAAVRVEDVTGIPVAYWTQPARSKPS